VPDDEPGPAADGGSSTGKPVAADRPTTSSTATWSTTSARPNPVGSPARPPWPWTSSTAITALVLAALVTVTAVWLAFTG
jgi:hypothetical protein